MASMVWHIAYTIQIWKSINFPTKFIKIGRSLITVIFLRILLFMIMSAILFFKTDKPMQFDVLNLLHISITTINGTISEVLLFYAMF